MKHTNTPPTPAGATSPALAALRHHVTGAIERGEAFAIAGIPAIPAPLDCFEAIQRGNAALLAESDALKAALEMALGTMERLRQLAKLPDCELPSIKAARAALAEKGSL